MGNINIGGRLHSTATGNVVAGANEILDDVKEKKQSVINAETDAALDDRYTKDETYSKQELDSLITTPNQEYVTVEDYASLPESGEADTIYRVANWDGSLATPAVDITKYSEYAWDGSQYVFLCVKSQIGEVFDISVYNNNAKYADLAAALNGGANIPQSLQKGGMSVKYVQTSDNKYVQYRLMSNTFNTTPANWQGVDDMPTVGSENLVKSGGVAAKSDSYPFKANMNIALLNAIKNIYLDYEPANVKGAYLKYFWNWITSRTIFYIHIVDINSNEIELHAHIDGTEQFGIAQVDIRDQNNISHGYAVVDWEIGKGNGFSDGDNGLRIWISNLCFKNVSSVLGTSPYISASQLLVKNEDDKIVSVANSGNTIFPLNTDNNLPAYLSAIKEYSVIISDYQIFGWKFGINYLWKNVDNLTLLRFVAKNNNNETVTLYNWQKENYTPSGVDIIEFSGVGYKVKCVIDFREIDDGLQYSAETYISKKNYHLNTIGADGFDKYFYGKQTDSTVLNALKCAYIQPESLNETVCKYYIAYLWKNYSGYWLVRIGRYKDGIDDDNYAAISRTEAPTQTIEQLKLGCVNILLDWSQISDNYNFNRSPSLEDRLFIRNNPLTLLPAQITNTADGYSVKDTIKHIITVDSLGNGDYTTISAACAAITDSSYDNQYEIAIFPGVYYENNISVPAFTHIHGIYPNSVVVTSVNQKDQNTKPVFDQEYASSKLSNMTIESYTGYCIHFDRALNTATVENGNLYLRKMYASDGTSYFVVGGGSFKYGTLFLWKNCIFEVPADITTGEHIAACHTNGNSNLDNTELVFDKCQFINCWAHIGSVGGFGNCIIKLNECAFNSGFGLNGHYSPIRNVDMPNTYFANNIEWQVVGGNNKNLLVDLNPTGEALQVIADSAVSNQKITLGGTALNILFGVVNYQVGGSRIKASATGIYLVKDVQAGMSGYSERTDVFQMWKRLGDCSSENKTLTVQINNGSVMTYTFNKNYLTSKDSETDILAAINGVLTGCQIQKFTTPNGWDNVNLTEKRIIMCTQANDILSGEWVDIYGKRCTSSTPKEDVLGIAVSDAVNGENIQVWSGECYKVNNLSDGNYGISDNGTLLKDASIVIGKISQNILERL